MMICYCLIQEGQLSQENVSRLEKSIENIVEEYLASGVKQSWVLGVGVEQVAVATGDTEAKWVMEGGHMIPEPGEEEAWTMPDWMRKK